MENTKNRFLDILEQSEARELFDEYDSSLNTVVHTGRVIEAFSLKIDFYDDIVMIVTSSYMGLDETNADSVRYLLDSMENRIFFDSIVNELLEKDTLTFRDIQRIRQEINKELVS